MRQCLSGRVLPDACHAAAFLRSFVGETPGRISTSPGVEAHEKASDRHAAGPSGWGVRLLDRLIADRFEDPHRA